MSSVDKLRNMNTTRAAIPSEKLRKQRYAQVSYLRNNNERSLAPKSVSTNFVIDMEIYKVESSFFLFVF